MSGDEFVFDEASGEWISAAEAAERASAAGQVEVRDSVGNLLADGDAVVLGRARKVKGPARPLRRGTRTRPFGHAGAPRGTDGRHETIKGLVLRAEFVKKA